MLQQASDLPREQSAVVSEEGYDDGLVGPQVSEAVARPVASGREMSARAWAGEVMWRPTLPAAAREARPRRSRWREGPRVPPR